MKYESLLDDFELIVGDSSEIYMIYAPDLGTFDTDWEAHVAISEDLEDATPLLVRPCPLNDELLDADGVTVLEPANTYFVVQISPEESSRMTHDIKYHFVVQIKNDTLGYKAEAIQCRLKAKKQGIFR